MQEVVVGRLLYSQSATLTRIQDVVVCVYLIWGSGGGVHFDVLLPFALEAFPLKIAAPIDTADNNSDCALGPCITRGNIKSLPWQLTPGVFCRLEARSSPSAMPPPDELALRLWSIAPRRLIAVWVCGKRSVRNDFMGPSGRDARVRRGGVVVGEARTSRSRDASMMDLVGASSRGIRREG